MQARSSLQDVLNCLSFFYNYTERDARRNTRINPVKVNARNYSFRLCDCYFFSRRRSVEESNVRNNRTDFKNSVPASRSSLVNTPTTGAECCKWLPVENRVRIVSEIIMATKAPTEWGYCHIGTGSPFQLSTESGESHVSVGYERIPSRVCEIWACYTILCNFVHVLMHLETIWEGVCAYRSRSFFSCVHSVAKVALQIPRYFCSCSCSIIKKVIRYGYLPARSALWTN